MVIVNSSDYAAPSGTYVIDRQKDPGAFKAYIPEFLYKPPYGYPRNTDILSIRKLAKTPYVHMIIRTLAQQVANTPWDIKVKEEYAEELDADVAIKEVKSFFDNPNGNDESFNDLLVMAVTDLLELDSGIWVKVFDLQGRMTQIVARDGGTFLKNPDPYGYLGNRIDILPPMNVDLSYGQPKEGQPYDINPDSVNGSRHDLLRNFYNEQLRHTAAYFQYGWTAGAMPVPFGKREIVWFSNNQRTDTIYGNSPVQTLADVLFILLYSSSYNLDMFVNNNIPAGVIQMIGATPDQVDAFKQRFQSTFIEKDIFSNNRTKQWTAPVANQEVAWTPFNFTSKDMQVLEKEKWYIKIAAGCFGVTPSELGFTEDSNRASETVQSDVFLRKALTPILRMVQEKINSQLMPEFGYDFLEFKFDDYDYASDKRKHDLLQQEINMGVKTSEMVAAELGINVDELKMGKEEARQRRREDMEAQAGAFDKSRFDASQKSFENDLEKELVISLEDKTKQLKRSLDVFKQGQI